MSLYDVPSLPVINFLKDSPQDILKDVALRARKQSIVGYRRHSYSRVRFLKTSNYHDAGDVVTKTINRVENFIKSIIKWGIFLSAAAFYTLGATTGGMLTGAIAFGSFLVIRVLNNKLSAVKEEYAKVYSWGISHFRSIFGAFFTNIPVMNYKLINNLY